MIIRGASQYTKVLYRHNLDISGNLWSYLAVQYIPSELARIYHRHKRMSRD